MGEAEAEAEEKVVPQKVPELELPPGRVGRVRRLKEVPADPEVDCPSRRRNRHLGIVVGEVCEGDRLRSPTLSGLNAPLLGPKCPGRGRRTEDRNLARMCCSADASFCRSLPDVSCEDQVSGLEGAAREECRR